MDQHHGTPAAVHCIDLNETPVSLDSTKKRKLEFEELGLPMSKCKFQDRSCGSDNESSNEINTECDEYKNTNGRLPDSDSVHSMESVKDSNSLGGETRECHTSMLIDVGSTSSSLETSQCPPDQPSTSYDCSRNNAFIHAIYSLDSRGTKSSKDKEPAAFNIDEDEDDIQLEKDYFDYGERDNITSESESNEIEHFGHVRVEDLLLYSNDVTSESSLLSSAKWDGKQGAKKPTIDQEFEQYFSMLML